MLQEEEEPATSEQVFGTFDMTQPLSTQAVAELVLCGVNYLARKVQASAATPPPALASSPSSSLGSHIIVQADPVRALLDSSEKKGEIKGYIDRHVLGLGDFMLSGVEEHAKTFSTLATYGNRKEFVSEVSSTTPSAKRERKNANLIESQITDS